MFMTIPGMLDSQEHERVLRTALEAGQDPHASWAAHRLGKPVGEVTFAERRAFKQESFFLLYSTRFLESVKWSGTNGTQAEKGGDQA